MRSGVSIKLMPLNVFNKLGLDEPKLTNMRLLMVYPSIKRPVGVVYDVLLKVDKFVYPVDFVLLDCLIDNEIPLYLVGHSWLPAKLWLMLRGVS